MPVFEWLMCYFWKIGLLLRQKQRERGGMNNILLLKDRTSVEGERESLKLSVVWKLEMFGE